MSNLFNLILLLAAGAGVAYLILKRRGGEPKIKKVVVVDPQAQKLYDIQKHKTDEEKALTVQEKIELSWQFLVNIKNQVLKLFSKAEQAKVERAGTILKEHGMKYQHDIEQEIRVKEFSKAKSITKTKEQEHSVSR